MPRVTIRLAESALLDLAGIRDWCSEQRVPDVGKRFLNEILERIQTLRDHPTNGRVVPEVEQPTLRELIHPPFRIGYRVQGSTVSIVRVWRSERLLQL